MSEAVQGVIARHKDSAVELVEIVIPNPGPHDVVVRIQTCGVCHTDLAYRDGGINDSFPFLLGHEAAGIVDAIGSSVTHVTVGDFVVLNWRAVCGECRACRRGSPEYCFNTHNASKPMTLTDGTELTPALGIGAFCEKTLVHEKQCTEVDAQADPAAAGLLGCGVMAGLGAAVNTGEIQRGESVAVIGLGGVGMAAVAGAKLAGATTIIAIDISDEKLEQARHFGATHLINSASLTSVHDSLENSRDNTSAASKPLSTDVATSADRQQTDTIEAAVTADNADTSDHAVTTDNADRTSDNGNEENTAENNPVAREVRKLTGGFGVDLVIDAVGRPETFAQAFYSRDLAGRVVLVGVPTPTMELSLPLIDVFSRGGSVKSSWYGDCLPERDFPTLIDLYLQGRFPLGDFVSERISLGAVEQAFSTMKSGKVLRSVVEL